jgi:hypothetical protein
MSVSSDNKRWLQQARKNWFWLAQGALWLGGILGGFLLPPPVGISASDEKAWLRLGQFIVAVSLGLEILAVRRWGDPRYSLRWAGVALVTLMLGVAAFFRYHQLTLAWTADYAGERVVIGAELSRQGEAYLQRHPKLSSDDLVFDFAGKTEEIWTRESIDHRRLVLAATYVSCLPIFTICLIAIVQAMQSGPGRVKGGAGKRRRL